MRWLKTTGGSTSSENLTDFPCSAFSGLGGGVLTRVSAGFADPLGPPLTPEDPERPLPNFFESLDPISSRAGVDTPSAAAWLTRAYKNPRQINVRRVTYD